MMFFCSLLLEICTNKSTNVITDISPKVDFFCPIYVNTDKLVAASNSLKFCFKSMCVTLQNESYAAGPNAWMLVLFVCMIFDIKWVLAQMLRNDYTHLNPWCADFLLLHPFLRIHIRN